MKKNIISCLIVLLLGIPCFVHASNLLEDSEIDYTEIVSQISNPERGFYSTMPIKCTPENTPIKTSKSNLIHMRIGIGEFSKANNGVEDIDFTDAMLESLNQTLDNIRKNGGMVIIRFAYDDFEGKSNREPTIEKIVRHIEQLQPLFKKNEDIIVCIESGFIGPWGEQHSSNMATKENFNKILDALLKSVPASRTINVRTPKIYTNYAGITQEAIQNDVTKKEDNTYRIGIFNDGYLGSESDLGTYKNREKEIGWLTNQAIHTFFGGEVVANYATNGYQYNSASHMIKEMFLTHTSYLNQEWNNSVIDEWKNTKYNGVDPIYQGKNAWEYINNHLGYRLVIRNMQLLKQVYQGENLEIEGKIENVGAGNIVNEKETIVILKQGDKIYSYSTNLDVRTWNSKEVTDIGIQVEIPVDLALGEWEVYLKIANPQTILEDNKRCIQFANKDVWNTELGANKLGNIVVLEKIKKPEENPKPEENSKLSENTNNIGVNIEKKDNTIVPGNLPKTGETDMGFPTLIFIGIAIYLSLYKKAMKK